MTEAHDNEPSVTSRTARGAMWMIGWRTVTRMLGLASTLVLARLLVPADFGLVAIATTLMAAIESLSELGLRDALVRHPKISRDLDDTAFTMQVLRGLISGTAIASGAWLAASWFGDQRLVPIILILAGVAVVGGFENIAIVRFQRELRFDLQFRLLLVPRLIQFVLIVGFAIAFRNYWALVLGIAIGRLARTAVTYVVEPYKPRLTLSHWRELIGFSFWSWASSLVGMVQQRCDAFVLGPSLGPAQLGIYLVASEIGLLPATELIGPTASALFAGFAVARNRGTHTLGIAVPLMAMLIMIVAPLSLGISATAGYVVAGLLGPNWVVGRPVIAIMALTCVIAPINYVSVTVMSATGHIHRAVYAKAAAAAIRVAALLLVASVPRLEWVAIAVGLALVGEACVFTWQLARCGRLAWRDSLPGAARTILACAGVAVLLWVSGLGWTPVHRPSIEALLVGGAIGAGTVVGCLGLQWLLWMVAGQPEGPEATLLRLVGQMLPGLRRRVGLA